MDGHIDGLAVPGQVLLVGSGVAAGNRLVGHTAKLGHPYSYQLGASWRVGSPGASGRGLRGARWISATTFGGQLRAAR